MQLAMVLLLLPSRSRITYIKIEVKLHKLYEISWVTITIPLLIVYFIRLIKPTRRTNFSNLFLE